LSVNEFFNRAEAIERMGGDEELFASVAKLFIESSAGYCAALDAAMRAADAPALRREAHTVKSMLATFSCAAGTAQALRLEELTAAGRLDGAQRLTDELVATVKRLAAALGAELMPSR
jgi:histidine phosphotransfer protein HptB